MRRPVAMLTLALIASVTAVFANGDRARDLRASLSGYNEIPTTFSSTGNARFFARINKEETEIEWKLTYEDLEAPVTQAHIHFGGKSVTGPVVVFFCTNLGNGPAGTQACPAPPATVSGTITSVDVLAGAAANGLEAGNLEELIAAIRAGATYANVHSTLRPGGEVRGQISARHGKGHH